jgi:outer membrane protein assembly factor BamB
VPSVVPGEDVVYAFGGFPRQGAIAVKLGGRGDVTKTHLAWSGRSSTYVTTPVAHQGRLYFVSDAGFASCLDARNGELIFRERLNGASAGGPGGKPFYSSAVLANASLYAVSRWNGVFVIAAQPQFKLVAQNKFSGDSSQFNATPAIADNQIFLRSDRFLYCVSEGS